MKKTLISALVLMMTATSFAASTRCKILNLENAEVKVCAEIENAGLDDGYESSQRLSHFTPDISAKIDGFTVSSGPKRVAWEICEAFNILSDGIEVVTEKSTIPALNIMAGKNQGLVTTPEKKDHRIVKSVVCHQMY